ncbi:flagellar assembly protein FliH [Aliidiomarina haloalkalitolerans]|uniref:Flagellar assembly protein FliH n=1 Tax=Aliidiomarina haloalkalitolerans TaxID=859059 RepID=A0A432VSA2_9GAMM|nr:flagellar assembly protein FliH [Aliidiomarina haloalkalitolerans]RUO19237.1 flagellar assembly protein FliH [Aliidiomarina haloalkalitolerans]
MFKPFSPQDLKKVQGDSVSVDTSESTQPAQTEILTGENWQRWSLDSLRSKLAQVQQGTEPKPAAQGRFVRDAELAALKEQARQEAWEQGHAEGYKAGHEAGYSDGAREANAAILAEKEQKIATVVTPLQQLATNFSAALDLADTQVADEIVALAVSIGTELARQQLDAKPEQIADLVRQLLHDESPFNEKAVLIVHPDDVQFIEQHLSDELTQHGWKISSDDRITRGGCKVSSKLGERDATWESRVRVILEQLRHRQESPSS